MLPSTSGVPFESKPISVLVPANSFHHVLIIGRPLEAGNLIVRGCFVQAPNGLSREFGLPLSSEEDEDKLMKRKTAIACEYGRTKYSGLAAHPWGRPAEKRTSLVGSSAKKSAKPIRYMDFKVVPELPLLRIRRTSLTHGAAMLYNGERRVFPGTLNCYGF
jgi:trafficking protein particle complex subunit 9